MYLHPHGVIIFEIECGIRPYAYTAAAFARAEYVEVVPAFADCTGRFVEVQWSNTVALALLRLRARGLELGSGAMP